MTEDQKRAEAKEALSKCEEAMACLVAIRDACPAASEQWEFWGDLCDDLAVVTYRLSVELGEIGPVAVEESV